MLRKIGTIWNMILSGFGIALACGFLFSENVSIFGIDAAQDATFYIIGVSLMLLFVFTFVVNMLSFGKKAQFGTAVTAGVTGIALTGIMFGMVLANTENINDSEPMFGVEWAVLGVCTMMLGSIGGFLVLLKLPDVVTLNDIKKIIHDGIADKKAKDEKEAKEKAKEENKD